MTTNPVTRHPAVSASAAATLRIESGGRAALVLGRGDSAVLQLGLRPATIGQLERAVGEIRRFLRGDEVNTTSCRGCAVDRAGRSVLECSAHFSVPPDAGHGAAARLDVAPTVSPSFEPARWRGLEVPVVIV